MVDKRKIYTRIEIDMDTGDVLAEESYLYTGPLALCEGAGGDGGEGGGDGGEGGEEGGGNGEGAAAPVTLGDILPEDMRGDKVPGSLKDFAKVAIPGADADEETVKAYHGKLGSVLKAYADTKSMVGGMIKLPGKDAKPEEIAAFRAKLGVPESPDKYELTSPKFEDDRIMFSDDMLNGFAAKAHEAGFTSAQVQTAVDFQADMLRGQLKAMDDEAAASMAELKKELGDQYDELYQGAELAAAKIFGEDALNRVKTSGLGNSASFVRGLMEIHKLTRESGDPKGLGDGDRRGKDVSAVQDEIDKLMSSKEYLNGDSLIHKKVAELFAKKQKLQGTFQAEVRNSQPIR